MASPRAVGAAVAVALTPYRAVERSARPGYLPWRFAVRDRLGQTVDV
jgi:hypothetical protein